MAYLGPFAKGLLNKTLDVVKDQLSRVDMQEAADATKALAGRGFEAAKIGAANIDVMEIAVATKDFAVAHPYFVGGQLVGTAIGIAPSWVSVPILSAMGFGPTGVAVATSASSWQATVGNVVAGSPFAYFESAAMGGHGLGVVNGAVRGLAVAGQAVGAFVAARWGKEQQ